jgi:hypothetical protein
MLRALETRARAREHLNFYVNQENSAKGPHEIGHGRANLSRTVFLDEMDALHRDFRLIRPSAAKLALTPIVKGARLRMEVKLRNLAVREPLTVLADNLGHVGRFTVERNLARPG